MSDPADLTIAAAGAAMRRGELTAVALTEAVLERARISESQIHAFLTLDQEGASHAAANLDGHRAVLVGVVPEAAAGMVLRQ